MDTNFTDIEMTSTDNAYQEPIAQDSALESDVASEICRRASEVARLEVPEVKLTAEQKKRLGSELGLMEKAYTMGVCSFALQNFVLFRYPQHFWIVHCVKAFIYLPWRFVRFKRNNWEWYMLEFCYFNAYYTVMCCFLAFIRVQFGIQNPLHPYNHELLRCGYTFANGALLWAIAIWGNKIVFHDVDNLTASYIHLSPALFFWALRWGGGFGTSLIEDSWPGMFVVCENLKDADKAMDSFTHMLWYPGECAGTVTEFVVYPAFVYLVSWAIPYSIVVFGIFFNYLKRNGKYNVYFETLDGTGVVADTIKRLPESLWPLGHMMVHFIWTTVSGLLAALMWNSFILNTAIVASLLFSMIHAGSTYTFRVVAAKQVGTLVAKVQAETDEENLRK